MDVRIKVLENGKGLALPSYATSGSVGVDLRAAIDDNIIIKPSERRLIPTGVIVAIPEGFEAQIRPRSGLAYKNGITILNAPGTIDSDYRGELGVLLINMGNEEFVVERGARIAQLIVQRYEKVSLIEVESLDETERAGNGYGSTGVV
jgi:dUTP pyrophosphatase